MTRSRQLPVLIGIGVALLPWLLPGCSLIPRKEPLLPPFVEAVEPPAPEGAKVEQVGDASWYGPAHDGKETASGETFDQDKLTAAHKTLPLGTKAVVTNLTTGKSVKVTINDRGPYVKGRHIDLSRAAAQTIGMTKKGVAKVKIQAKPRRKPNAKTAVRGAKGTRPAPVAAPIAAPVATSADTPTLSPQ